MNVHTLENSPQSRTITELPNGQADAGENNVHGLILLHRECSGREVEISLGASGCFGGRVAKNGISVPAVICGLNERKIELPDENTVKTIKGYLEQTDITVRENQVKIGKRNPELERGKLEGVLSGMKRSDDLREVGYCTMELDRRLKAHEKCAQENDSGTLFCHARSMFLELADPTETDDLNVFIRTMNNLIYGLEKDRGDITTSENLKKIVDELWNRMEGFSGQSIIRLEKLTRAFGLALNTLIAHYEGGNIPKLIRNKQGKKEEIDIKTQICNKVAELKKCIERKNTRDNLEIVRSESEI